MRVYVLRTTALSRSETVCTTCLGTKSFDTCITSYRYGLRTVPENATVVVPFPTRSSRAVPSFQEARMLGRAVRSPVGCHRVQALPCSSGHTISSALAPAFAADRASSGSVTEKSYRTTASFPRARRKSGADDVPASTAVSRAPRSGKTEESGS
ncbi:hypothetical protein SCANM63S_06631 [Streptomyces canarius]